MTRAELDLICAAMPGAERAGPPKPDSWQVGGKMFAFFGAKDEDGAVSLHSGEATVAEAMIASGRAEPAPYFKAPWIRLDFARIDPDYAAKLVAMSYDTVRSGLTKKAQAALPPREET